MPRATAIALNCLALFSIARGAADPDLFHHTLKAQLHAEPLRWNPIHNEHLIAGEIDGKTAEFHIDTGAARSILSLAAARRLGLRLADTGRMQPGIGGEEAIYSATIRSLRVGGTIELPHESIPVLEMPSTLPSDGLIGGDVLNRIGAVIDHRTHLLLTPQSGQATFDIAAAAERSGMTGIPLESEGEHHFLTLLCRGEPLRFVLDTGSQQSLLDTATAERLGLHLVETDVRAVGVGDQPRVPRITTVDGLGIQGISLVRMPMLVMPIDAFGKTSARKVDGILGAEFLFSSGAVLDAGNRRLYLPPGDIDVRPYSKTGSEMLGSDDELARLFRESSWVGTVKVLRFTLESEASRARSPDPSRSAARIDLEILGTLKDDGRFTPGTTAQTTVLLKHRTDLADWATGVFGRNPRKILFLPSPTPPVAAPRIERALFTDGELPRAQLQRVLKTGS